MAKRTLFPFGAVLAVLLVMAGCGKPEEGMNELTLKQLEEKLDNQETFLLLTFAADEKDVKDTKLIEAFDDSLKQEGLTGFYVNLKGEDEQKLIEWGREHTHPQAEIDWEPVDDGLVLINNGSKIYTGSVITKNMVRNMASESLTFMNDDDIVNGVDNILEYAQTNNINLEHE
ncbi:hypothetical protein ACFSCZ_12565 [Siminovitchia sediminis]|uniref:Lipoprotein n=1 Tax=Siminovitchia sediminis TaxID=1274353 RepID=A0ABW4KHY7_9BACI